MYKVVHCRKAEEVLSSELNSLAKSGWRLHTLLEKTSAYVLIMEYTISPEAITPVDKPTPRRKKEAPVLVTSEDVDNAS